MTDFASLIRTIPDFPKPGILFRDVTTLMRDAAGFAAAIEALAAAAPEQVDYVAGLEARGFIPGAALAVRLGAGFIPLRKAGKLPGGVLGVDYALEYGEARLELHIDAIPPGARVLLVDDLIATGGTALAGLKLIAAAGGHAVGVLALIDLPDLGGSARLRAQGLPVRALVEFPGH